MVRMYVASPVAGVDCREPAVCRLVARVTRARTEQGPGHSCILGFRPSNGEMTRGGVEASHEPPLPSFAERRSQLFHFRYYLQQAHFHSNFGMFV